METVEIQNKPFSVPARYVPVGDLLLCSNRLINSRFIIEDNGFYPLLIGKGEIPQIWLFAKNIGEEVITLVGGSVSVVSTVRVYNDMSTKVISIVLKAGKNILPIIEVDYKSTMLVVSQLNMKPLGYNIQGDEKGLQVGNTTIQGNTFTGVRTMVSLNNQE